MSKITVNVNEVVAEQPSHWQYAQNISQGGNFQDKIKETIQICSHYEGRDIKHYHNYFDPEHKTLEKLRVRFNSYFLLNNKELELSDIHKKGDFSKLVNKKHSCLETNRSSSVLEGKLKKTRQEKLEEALTVLKQKYGLDEKPETGKRGEAKNPFYENKSASEFIFCILKYYYGAGKPEIDKASKTAFTTALVHYLEEKKYTKYYDIADMGHKTAYNYGKQNKKTSYREYASEIALQLSYLEYEPLIRRALLK